MGTEEIAEILTRAANHLKGSLEGGKGGLGTQMDEIAAMMCLSRRPTARQIGQAVAFHRVAAGHSQQALAAALGLEQSVLCRRETGEHEFRAREILAIADLLDVHPMELLNPGHSKEAA